MSSPGGSLAFMIKSKNSLLLKEKEETPMRGSTPRCPLPLPLRVGVQRTPSGFKDSFTKGILSTVKAVETRVGALAGTRYVKDHF